MKRNSFDFTRRTRQSYVAILMIVYKTFNVIIRQLWPVILVLVVGRGSNTKDYILYTVIVGAALTMIYSIINFFRYFFYIDNDGLIIEKGVLSRTRLNIPFDRIQTINFEQNIAHQVFDVVRLNIDTAGSAKSEFKFDALDKDMADALRALILAKKRTIESVQPLEEKHGIEEHEIVGEPIVQLSFGDLLKIGVTENHLRSFGLIFVFFFWIWENLDQAGFNFDEVTDQVPAITYGFVMILVISVLFMIISFLISLIRTVFKYFDLRFWRLRNGFKLNSGLLTKRDVSALDQKIQMLSWDDNPLRKILGLKEFRLRQAGSVAIGASKSISIPGCSQEQVDTIWQTIYGTSALDNIEMYSIDWHYLYRRILYLTIIPLVLVIAAYLVGKSSLYFLSAGIAVFFWVSSYFIYRKKKYGFNDEMIKVDGGAFGDKTELIPIYKIQAVKLVQSIYQRRHDLASLELFTAAGSVQIPYIEVGDARKISDFLMYKVEIDKRGWM